MGTQLEQLQSQLDDIQQQINELKSEPEEKRFSGFTEAQIQRIIDEGFLVTGDGKGVHNLLRKLKSFSPTCRPLAPFQTNDGRTFKDISLVREIGIRQPNFNPQYDGHEYDRVLVNTGQWYGHETHLACDIDNWQDVKEFIVVEAG